MSHPLAHLLEHCLPCPPDPPPQPGSDAWCLWQATLCNARQRRPWRTVEILEYVDLNLLPAPDLTVAEVLESFQRYVRVECDAEGRGVRVIR